MTIMLNGSDLTVTQVVGVARHGQAVALTQGDLGLAVAGQAITVEARTLAHPVRPSTCARPVNSAWAPVASTR